MIFNSKVGGKLYSYFTTKLNMRDYRNGWLKGDCPFCGKQEKFGVNIVENRTNCFSCGSHRSPFLCLLELEQFQTYSEGYKLLGTLESIENFSRLPKEIITESKLLALPEGFKLLQLGNSIIANLARQYMKSRGFNIMKLTLKGIGYCETGKYSGSIIFPFYHLGKLVYFIARKFIHITGAKFDNPTIEEVGIGKSFLIYNIDVLAFYKTIRLVESITNAETLGNTAIATLGKSVSNYQLNCLIKSPVENIIIYLDPDAKIQAIKLGLKLVEYKRIKVVFLPEGQDVNSYGKAKSKLLEKKAQWLNYNQLLSLLKEYET